MDEFIIVNVEGVKTTTFKSTLEKMKYFNEYLSKNNTCEIFLDKDHKAFHACLNYVRDGTSIKTKYRADAEFYGIDLPQDYLITCIVNGVKFYVHKSILAKMKNIEITDNIEIKANSNAFQLCLNYLYSGNKIPEKYNFISKTLGVEYTPRYYPDYPQWMFTTYLTMNNLDYCEKCEKIYKSKHICKT